MKHIVLYIIFCFLIYPVPIFAQRVVTQDERNIKSEVDSHLLWAGIGYSTGLDKAKYPLSLQQYSITLWGYKSKGTVLQYTLSYLYSPIPESPTANFSSKNGLKVFELSLDAKYYSPYEFVSYNQYLSGGIGLAVSAWKYSDNYIKSDLASSFSAAVGIDFRFGTGFVLGYLQSLNATVDFSPGIIIWLPSEDDISNGDNNPPIYLYFTTKVALNYSIAKWD